ncbi:hypothetical protein HYV11_00780 [Candidatus Dependentiae bacterium]|nr:hypothetical protein [Candidatus Dependentiae bacterium]
MTLLRKFKNSLLLFVYFWTLNFESAFFLKEAADTSRIEQEKAEKQHQLEAISSIIIESNLDIFLPILNQEKIDLESLSFSILKMVPYLNFNKKVILELEIINKRIRSTLDNFLSTSKQCLKKIKEQLKNLFISYTEIQVNFNNENVSIDLNRIINPILFDNEGIQGGYTEQAMQILAQQNLIEILNRFVMDNGCIKYVFVDNITGEQKTKIVFPPGWTIENFKDIFKEKPIYNSNNQNYGVVLEGKNKTKTFIFFSIKKDKNKTFINSMYPVEKEQDLSQKFFPQAPLPFATTENRPPKVLSPLALSDLIDDAIIEAEFSPASSQLGLTPSLHSTQATSSESVDSIRKQKEEAQKSIKRPLEEQAKIEEEYLKQKHDTLPTHPISYTITPDEDSIKLMLQDQKEKLEKKEFFFFSQIIRANRLAEKTLNSFLQKSTELLRNLQKYTVQINQRINTILQEFSIKIDKKSSLNIDGKQMTLDLNHIINPIFDNGQLQGGHTQNAMNILEQCNLIKISSKRIWLNGCQEFKFTDNISGKEVIKTIFPASWIPEDFERIFSDNFKSIKSSESKYFLINIIPYNVLTLLYVTPNSNNINTAFPIEREDDFDVKIQGKQKKAKATTL